MFPTEVVFGFRTHLDDFVSDVLPTETVLRPDTSLPIVDLVVGTVAPRLTHSRFDTIGLQALTGKAMLLALCLHKGWSATCGFCSK